MQTSRNYFLILLSLATSCATAPKINEAPVSERESRAWLSQYCSRGMHAFTGDLMIKSSTRDFQGQYPASIRFQNNGSFVLEVTNILGGTMLRLSSDGKSMATEVPPNPKFNRKGITHYLGLDLPVLTALLMGDLPCPADRSAGRMKSEGNRMVMQSPQWIWNFEKSEISSGGVPARITLLPTNGAGSSQKVVLTIEDWDKERAYAKRVTVKSSEGELHWTWRNREN